MKNKVYYIIMLLLFFCNACATEHLWKKTDPNQYVKIKYSDISEQELKDQKLKYIKDDNFKSYLVEFDSFSKLKNYTIRFLITPITLVIDTASIVVIAIALYAGDYNCDRDPNCQKQSDYYKENYWERERL